MKSKINSQDGATNLLSDKDRQILTILQNDGRVSNQELAEEVAMSTSACWRRVRILEKAGLIEGYTVKVNPEACGFEFHAIVHVMLARHQMTHLKQFTDEIIKRDEVLDCFSTTGGADYHLRVRCTDLDAYNLFLEDFLFNLDGVASIQTNIVLQQLKHSDQLAL